MRNLQISCSDLRDVARPGCKLAGCTNLAKATVDSLCGADLNGVDLNGVDKDCTDASFRGAKLRGALNVGGAKGVDLREAILEGFSFHGLTV